MNKALVTIRNYALSVLAPVLMIALLLLVSPETRSVSAVISLLRQGFAPAVLGWGVLFNMKVGNWDFSIGARFVLATILAGNLAMNLNFGVPGMVVLSIVISLVLGIIVGLAYKFLRIPTLIVSIGICLIFESLTRIIYGGAGTHITNEYMRLGTSPYDVIAFALCFAIAAFIYFKRKLGYNVRAVGSNPTVAQTNGINALNTKTMALIISGLFAGLYCILSLSKSGVCSAVSGTLGSAATVFDAMMCVLIGMAICGKGNIILSIYSGALITQVLKMGMMAIGLPTTYNKVVIAVFVVLFMVSSSKTDSIKKFAVKFHRKAKAS